MWGDDVDEATAGGGPSARVFISYAHEGPEHEKRVRDLWLFLRRNGIDAVLDLAAAERRQDWPLWMLEQVREARFVLVVASPEYRRRADGAAASDQGRGLQFEAGLIREEVYRDRPAAVDRFIPVLLPGYGVDDIPSWLGPMTSSHYQITDLSVAGAERLLRLLTDQPFETTSPVGPVPLLAPRSTSAAAQSAAGAPTLERKLRAIPPTREGIIDRPELRRQVVGLICNAADGPIVLTTGLFGTGGFGKTTLAAQVCREPEVAEWFPGGLIWTTLGKDVGGAELVSRLNDLIEQLSGTRPTLSDAEQAGFKLGEALDARRDRVLMVLDDVWRPAQLYPFLLGGRNCRRLITTRNQRLLTDAGSVRVDQMSDEQASAVLSRGLPGLTGNLATELLALSGRWPVLLDLTNRAIRKAVDRGDDVVTASTRIVHRLRKAGPAGLDPLHSLDIGDARQRREAVAATVAASVDLAQQGMYERYTELSIFPEDTEIPCSVLEILWGSTGNVDSAEVERLCEELFELSLILSYRVDLQSIRLHDVLRSHLRSIVGRGRLTALNERLVDAAATRLEINQRTGEGSRAWWTLGADQHYFLDHLTAHLSEAGRRDELVGLVSDLRWLHTQASRGGLANVESDLERAQTPTTDALAQAIRQSRHLFEPIQPAGSLAAVILSRLQSTQALRRLTGTFAATMSNPRLVNKCDLPDEPHPGLLRTLSCHPRRVTSVTISSDGQWLLTTGADLVVRVWNTNSWQAEFEISTAHTGDVMAVAISPERAWIATGARDGLLKIFDAETRRRRLEIAVPGSGIGAVAVATEGSWAATGSKDGVVRIWDTRTWDLRDEVRAHGGWIGDIAISPDASWFATCSRYEPIRIWASGTLNLMRELAGTEADEVFALAVSPDGTWLAASGLDNMLNLWATDTWLRIAELNSGHDREVDGVAIAPDGAWLVTCGDDSTARIWDTSEIRKRARNGPAGVDDHRKVPISSVVVAPDGAWIASATEGAGQLQVWDAQTGRRRPYDLRRKREIAKIALAPNGNWAATVHDDRTLRISDTKAWRQRRKLQLPHDDFVTTVAISPGETWIATGSQDGTVLIWDVAQFFGANSDRRPKTPIELVSPTGTPVWHVHFSPDGKWLAVAGLATAVQVWNVATWQLQAEFESGHDGGVTAVAISPSGEWLATGGRDNAGRVWRTGRWSLHTELDGHSHWVTGIAAASNRRIATVSLDGSIRIWNAETGQAETSMRVDGSLNGCHWLPRSSSICAVGYKGIYMFELVGSRQLRSR
jgi:WD40 repeat protein